VATIQQARDAKSELQRTLRDEPGVNGIGLARLDDEWGVQVNVVDGDNLMELHIPDHVGIVPVCTRRVGHARAYTD
jgi:hypothetical protein